MYKLMIVEDEPLIRAGLKQYFNWPDLGIHTILEAENGKQGIETALNEQPDLVITDIRMPEIDGLEMIEKLRGELPDTLFVILTGYNEFQYAQRAIRTGGVQEYLLKPLQYKESLETIHHCMEILKKKTKERHIRTRLERESMENSKHRGSQIVKLLLEEDAVLDEQAVRTLMDFSCGTQIYQPLVATCLPPASGWRQLGTNWRNQMEQTIIKAVRMMIRPGANLHILSYYSKSKMYSIGIFDAADLLIPDSKVDEHLNVVLQHASSEIRASMFTALGSPAQDPLKLGANLRQLEKTLYQRFFRPGRLFRPQLADSKSEHKKEPLAQLTDKDMQAMMSCLENGDAAETKQLMLNLAQTAAKSSPDKLLAYLQEVISVTLRFASKHDIQMDGVYSERLFNLSCVDDFQSLEQLFDWIGSWILHLNAVYEEVKENQNDTQTELLFKKIESFILEHIDQDVTLQMVADRFFYNPSYLSRFFKSKLNKNYLTFVTEIRIRYAQQCLADPQMLITDACKMCGYKSYKHFVKTFKNITRMTPTEYRKQLGL